MKTYSEIAAKADADREIRTHNVVTMGDGESLDSFAPYPIGPEGMPLDEWNKFQSWVMAQQAPCVWDKPRAYKMNGTQGG